MLFVTRAAQAMYSHYSFLMAPFELYHALWISDLVLRRKHGSAEDFWISFFFLILSAFSSLLFFSHDRTFIDVL